MRCDRNPLRRRPQPPPQWARTARLFIRAYWSTKAEWHPQGCSRLPGHEPIQPDVLGARAGPTSIA